MSASISSLPGARRYIHQDLIFVGTNTTVAIAAVALKWFLLSKNDSVIAKIPYFIAGLAGLSACINAVKAIKFYSKRRYLVAPALALSIEKNEKAFDTAFKNITQNCLVSTLLDVNGLVQPSENTRKDFFKMMLSYGVCSGIATTLIKLITKQPTASCSDLLKSLNQENQITNIFYSQMLHIMQSTLEPLQKSLVETLQAPYGHTSNEERETATQLLSFFTSEITSIKEQLYPVQNSTSSAFAITEPSSVYYEQLKTFIESRSASPEHPFAGRVCIETTAKFGKSPFMAGHAIFFQISQDRYRFYDSIGLAEGFYEYIDKNIFIEALRSQLLEDVGKDAKVLFTT